VITWDEPKRLANIDKHGLDFADFEAGFDFETALALPAPDSATGRQRVKVIGLLKGVLVVVAILSPLGSEAAALISLRRASREERSLYEQHQG
jgi:uncharacterized DUF497 family protein